MDNITKCYLNTITNDNNTIFSEKLKSKREQLKKKILLESKKIICEQVMVYQSVPGENTSIQFNDDGSIKKIEGMRQVDITVDSKPIHAQITTDKQLIHNLQSYKETAKQLSPQQIQKLQEGVGEDNFKQLKQGGALLFNGLTYLIEAPGKILSWGPKQLGKLLSPETNKKYVQPYKAYEAQMHEQLAQKAKEASDAQLQQIEQKNKEFYEALQSAPDGVMLYDRVTKKLYVKHQGKFKFASYVLPGMAGNPQGAKKSMDAATKQALADGKVPEGNGADNFKSNDGRYIMSNPALKQQFMTGCKKLKLRDKKSQGNFLQMIQKMFAAMFGMGNNEQDNYEEYTDSQRMSFSPFIRKIVKNGTLPPGTYKFEYK